ncbi:tail length tape measure protein [Arthrobacter phage Adumb2043]|uniref:Endolysin n=1 Tax=Arthrobacter phage Adumb2043 TaxID=2776851 RepID=A0A7M1CLB3_9CAUD|nr:tail length tape measure protein [Arthrobacter phage Adumb2043]QOP65116.1 endolysin [Arthrobacter phage Adumb2043]
MVRPVDARFEESQGFGSFATAGVVGNPYGTTVQRLVAQYGNYQPFGHAGVDIACPIGTPVYAMADGVVVWADWGTKLPGDNSEAGWRSRWYFYKGFPGILTLIHHPQLGPNVYTAYAHLSDNNMAPAGTRVKAGQLIAKSGNTGGVAPHLHIEELVDLTYRTGGGLIYGRRDPQHLFTIPASGSLSPASSTPTTEGDDELSAKDVQEIKEYIHALLIGGYVTGGQRHPGIGMVVEENQRRIGRVAEDVWKKEVIRAGGNVAAIQELANVNTTLNSLAPAITGLPSAVAAAVQKAVVENLPKAVADEIPDDIAQDVIDALAERLAKK